MKMKIEECVHGVVTSIGGKPTLLLCRLCEKKAEQNIAQSPETLNMASRQRAWAEMGARAIRECSYAANVAHAQWYEKILNEAKKLVLHSYRRFVRVHKESKIEGFGLPQYLDFVVTVLTAGELTQQDIQRLYLERAAQHLSNEKADREIRSLLDEDIRSKL